MFSKNSSNSHEYLDITQHEIEALKFEYNLADAHTHQSQSPTQEKIVERLPDLWHEAEKTKQGDMEKRFIEAFFRSQRQNTALTTPTMLVYAASIGMVAIANYLMKKKMSVALLHPCFDNIHDILKHMHIPLEPLEENWLHDSEKIYDNLKKHVKADALFVIDPNNPTGFTLTGSAKDPEETKRGFMELFRYAKDHNKLLLFDFCFASFLLPGTELGIFEIYKELEDSGVSYITIEDTGKTWPLQDTKVAIIKTSKDLHDEIYNIHTSYLLNVSPFILNLVSQYIEDSIKDSFASVHDLLSRNRETAKRELKNSLLEFQEPKTNVSVAWFKITDPNIKATDLQKAILTKGVYVLPGTYFFWNDQEQGQHYIRIALARNTNMFEPAIKLVREALDEYGK
ncbi:MAG: aspartate/tyrosine/aromatic aminotransferase [Candidatus Yanofskybacteria bacterium RIFCSPHIGHO2_01_FULL_44_17]|uniref:Aspartate/tyrosine/aromatic aminotransferase n=1 Tax=Candidatus Yanofskybacteria bacterium RIFCSPHIGHO2_01_FULL_44_17 TaxID=1802668 RepID=A0A1F8EZ36_9BACT|nr:MAG: aspartate/tyrosine/aromatic aminotransferase [Candidatus Yanofskybacteria bacterium RIFCSPHIGHO2_01_FULL_44_17]